MVGWPASSRVEKRVCAWAVRPRIKKKKAKKKHCPNSGSQGGGKRSGGLQVCVTRGERSENVGLFVFDIHGSRVGFIDWELCSG